MNGLRTNETGTYLCPLPDGEGGTCAGELFLEVAHVLWLGPDDPPDRPLSDATVEELGAADAWRVECTLGHRLAVGPDDGNGPPPFRLGAFLAGGAYADPSPEDAPVMIVGREVGIVELSDLPAGGVVIVPEGWVPEHPVTICTGDGDVEGGPGHHVHDDDYQRAEPGAPVSLMRPRRPTFVFPGWGRADR